MSAGETAEGRDDYLARLEEHFAGLRGHPLTLSPADWQMADGWRRQGIPLPVVLRALDQVFARRKARAAGGTVLTLAYCRHAVEQSWADLKSVRAGSSSPEGPGAAGVATRLRERARQLLEAAGAWPAAAGPAAQAALAAAEAAAEGLEGGDDPAALEAGLLACEEAVLAALYDSLDGPDLESLTAGAARRLDGHRERMSPDAWERTLRHAVLRQVRKRFSVPRLSLLDV